MIRRNMMKLLKKSKKIVLALLVAILMCGMPEISVCAAEPDNQEDEYGVSPCYSYTSSIYSGLTISDGDAICSTSIKGYNSVVTKITVTQTLQKKSGSSWVDVWSWTNTVYDYRYTYTNYHYPLTKGTTYRVKAYVKVYAGSNYESMYSYSDSATY